jgi:hypothetical protein
VTLRAETAYALEEVPWREVVETWLMLNCPVAREAVCKLAAEIVTIEQSGRAELPVAVAPGTSRS